MKKIKTSFHEWLDSKGYTIQSFAALIGQGYSTVASWRTKSVKGEAVHLYGASLSNLAQRCPECPLVPKVYKYSPMYKGATPK
jgi:hypothetical protein